ncbi:hypothetical protein KO525_08905 [Psychrosphaera sp. B3R10]|uniref:hypothetical protein n=1 Tax=unclassified Psychrosphaera TaxID=2641570 RepID=UPI001C086083|nr:MULTISPECIES: hypothetical protein [unclassified Psychrosphaera]MBU2881495.1 hypothetical protein [Psychrosphaera sp. I2R16]MBU2989493.1 hypothetical protein [Psychrosphaera sp. B3R10]
MNLVINERKVENPLVALALVLFALSIVGGVIAFVLFVILPLIGIFISGLFALIFAFISSIILWLVLPVLFLSIIGWFFGKLLK